jgi:hypothetical protein
LSETPLQVTAEGPELHPRKVGHKWVDYVVAGAAIIISIISLVVAIEHGRTMEKLVAANSWPLLRYDTGNLDDETQLPVITLTIENAGVGPAMVKSFAVFLDGKRVADQGALLRACCGEAPQPAPQEPGGPAVGVITSDIPNTVIRAGERRDYIRLARPPGVSGQWEALNRARFRLTFEACYCSVLGDCWTSNLTGVDAHEIDECPAGNEQTGQAGNGRAS